MMFVTTNFPPLYFFREPFQKHQRLYYHNLIEDMDRCFEHGLYGLAEVRNVLLGLFRAEPVGVGVVIRKPLSALGQK